jgi:MFS family permease
MLPMALLSLPSGALADIVDRRKLLIFAQSWGMIAAGTLFLATLAGRIDALLLICLVFITASGSALSLPALQAITSEIVPRSSLAHTVTLAGISNNIARIAGPAAGGLLIALAGAEWVFLANCLSMLGVILALRRWKSTAQRGRLPPEHLLGAIRAGFRYVHSSVELHALMVRSIAFFLCASALWALLPLIGRQQLGLGPAGYGLMITGIGAGAIAGALSLKLLRRRFAANELSQWSSLLLAAAVAALAVADNLIAALACMVAAGFGWNVMTASLQSTALVEAASWAKARAFGIFLMVFQGSMAAGAVLWGMMALEIGISNSLLAAAGLLAVSLFLASFYPLIIDPNRDLSPSRHWPDPILDQVLDDDEGPVLVTVEYEVDPELSQEFVIRLHRLRAIRLRDGAMRWRYWRDVSHRSLIIETFIVSSWLEHLRQHDRVTEADRALQDQVNELHIGAARPLVRHWIAIR